MKNNQGISMKLILSILFFALGAFIISSCSKKEEVFSSENSQIANNESSQDATTDETDDLATSAISSDPRYAAGGRIATIADDRLACDGTSIVFSNENTDNTTGTVTITFGTNGCTDKRGNVRKGQIVVTWTGGKWYNEGSTRTIVLNDYSVNGVKITGTRTITTTDFSFTNTSFSLAWTVSASHTLTWPNNGGVATRTISKSKQWSHTATEDTYTETNGPGAVIAASGLNRHGKEYKMTIVTPLIYLGSCVKSNKVYMPVSGVKLITDVAMMKDLTIDFGAATCDNTFIVTVDGQSKTLTGSNN